MDKTLILLIGAGIGSFSSVLIYLLKIQHTISLKLFEKFLSIHKEATDCISELAQLSIFYEHNEEDLTRISKAISKIYYTNYDFLPSKVLIELNCLHMCISSKGSALYTYNALSRDTVKFDQ